MESHLLDILVCPLCKSGLHHDRTAQELICRADKLAFPIRDGIPVMLESEARTLSDSTPTEPCAPVGPATPTDESTPDPQA